MSSHDILSGAAGTFQNLGGGLLLVLIFMIVLVCWGVVFLYIIKYNIPVLIRKEIGNSVKEYTTKAGVIYNNKRKRDELHILKSKWSAPMALFMKSLRWEKPVPDSKKYHANGKRGRLEFKQVGERADDLHHVLPPGNYDDKLNAVNSEHYDWTINGIMSDARELRTQKDTWEKVLQFGVPILLVGIMLVAIIITWQKSESVLATQQQVSANLAEATENLKSVSRANSGIQDVERENEKVSNNTAVQITRNVGILE